MLNIYCREIYLYNYKNNFYFKCGGLSLYDVIIVHHGNINTWHLNKSGGKINDLKSSFHCHIGCLCL